MPGCLAVSNAMARPIFILLFFCSRPPLSGDGSWGRRIQAPRKDNGIVGIHMLNPLLCTYGCVVSFILCVSFQLLDFSYAFLTVFS